MSLFFTDPCETSDSSDDNKQAGSHKSAEDGPLQSLIFKENAFVDLPIDRKSEHGKSNEHDDEGAQSSEDFDKWLHD